MKQEIMQINTIDVSKTSVLLLLSLFLIACTNKFETGMDVFKKENYQNYLLVTGTLINETTRENRKNVGMIKFSGTKILSFFPNQSSLENINCQVLNELRMVAPPKTWTGLHRTLDMRSGEQVMAYVGLKDGVCEVVHISAIKDDKLYFPKWKDQKPLTLDIREAKAYLVETFNKVFYKK